MEEGIDDNNSPWSRRMIDGRTVNTSQWATPDEGALTGDRRVLYLARKRAVSLYLSGASAESIRRLTSLGAKQVYRLIRERCLQPHPDGRPFGWRGLVPWLRVTPYRRSRKVHVDQFGRGAAGAMQALLDCQPALRQAFEARILASASAKRLVETKQSRRRHCAWFLDQLRSFGYEARNDWPFSTASLGYSSICRYIDKVLSANPRALAASTGGPNLALKLKTGDGACRPVLRFMQRVEMDARKLDGRFCVSLPLMGGGFREKIVHRLWVVVIIEVVSRAVLGYYFSVRREVSKDDVLRALKRALGRWCLRPVSFCDTPYLPEAGLLSALGNDFVGLCWDETSVDGALAETCQHVRDALRDSVGSALLDPKTYWTRRHRSPNDEARMTARSSRRFSAIWPDRDFSVYPTPLAASLRTAGAGSRRRLPSRADSSTSMPKSCWTCLSLTTTRHRTAALATARRSRTRSSCISIRSKPCAEPTRLS